MPFVLETNDNLAGNIDISMRDNNRGYTRYFKTSDQTKSMLLANIQNNNFINDVGSSKARL